MIMLAGEARKKLEEQGTPFLSRKGPFERMFSVKFRKPLSWRRCQS